MGTDVGMEREARENKKSGVSSKKINFSSVMELCFPNFHLSFAV